MQHTSWNRFFWGIVVIVQATAETAIVLRRMQLASGHARYSHANAAVVRAFPALLLGQNFGKMMVREARQA